MRVWPHSHVRVNTYWPPWSDNWTTVIGGRGGIIRRLSRASGAGVHPVARRCQHCTSAARSRPDTSYASIEQTWFHVNQGGSDPITLREKWKPLPVLHLSAR
jgi:hypothetical protein